MQNIDESKFKKSVGEHIKMYRKITQEDLSEKAQISSDTLSLIERGENTASSLTLLKICNALNITPNHLLVDFISNKDACIDSIILNEIPDLTQEEKEFILCTINFIKQNKHQK